MRHESFEGASARWKPERIGPFHSSHCAARCRALASVRARRALFFDESLFFDPAWDILLELFAANCEGRRLSISAVGLTAKIPPTTVLRWIAVLEQKGLLAREEDPHDARRTFLNLSADGFGKMLQYFQTEA